MSEHPKKVVLLDLDGTLTKSDPGIIGCVVKAFEEMGYPVPDDAELHRFIGPAISESMQRNGIPDDKLDEGVRIYRKYYADEAVFDDPNNPGQKVPGRLNNTIYQGIPEQLAKLRADGYYLAIASCKPQYQCIPICEHFHLDTMVDGIYGASEDNSRLDKDQAIRLGFPAHRFRRERRRQGTDGRRPLDRCRRRQGVRFGLPRLWLGLCGAWRAQSPWRIPYSGFGR